MDASLRIFPNPATDRVVNVLSTSRELGAIEIYNVTGQKVLTKNGNGASSTQVDLTKLNPGVYFIRLENLGTGKFIVK